ncbi:MAG: sialate O-acetylesterase [Akkermansiaceae bacterium]
MNHLGKIWICAIGTAICLGAHSPIAAKTVKVFILAGQSNMQGHGAIEGKNNDGKGSLTYLAENNDKFAHLRKGKSGWAERDDVMIAYLGRKGPLAPGYGARSSMIGPELGFGHVVGDAIDEPVLLIKTAWGGKSLHVDFRPPSAGGQVGPYYTEMVTYVKSVLDNMKKEFPKLGSDYEIAGFGWHQGWNDGCDVGMSNAYEENMQHFIRDIRKEFGVEDLPFVVADSGFGGSKENSGRRFIIREAQAAAAKAKDLKNVHCVKTGSYFRPVEESPSKQGYHWNSNAETYYLIGEAMGKAMLEMSASSSKKKESRTNELYEFRNADGTKSFKARLVKFDAATGKVTVRKVGGRSTTFDLTHLHPDDQKYVKGRK